MRTTSQTFDQSEAKALGDQGEACDLTLDQQDSPRTGLFPETHWNLVHLAGECSSEPFPGALARLCSAYWYPLYAYIRGRGFTCHDAEDLVQGFFLRLIGCLSG